MPDTKLGPLSICGTSRASTQPENRVLIRTCRGHRFHATHLCSGCASEVGLRTQAQLGRLEAESDEEHADRVDNQARLLLRPDYNLAHFVGNPEEAPVREARARLVLDWTVEGEVHLHDGMASYNMTDGTIDYWPTG